MALTFRLKAQTVTGIDVDAPVAQAADIAKLINAQSFIVDVVANNAKFVIEGRSDMVVVGYGQVVVLENGEIMVYDRAAFYELYEVGL